MMWLLGRHPLKDYSQHLRIAAAANLDPAVVDYVFRRANPESVHMLELEFAAETSDTVFGCVLGHYTHAPEAEATPSKTLGKLIARNCRRPKTLREAFEWRVAQEPNSPGDFEKLLDAAVQNEHGLEMASFLLKRYQMTENRIRVSSRLLEAAAANHTTAPEMVRLLLNQCDDRWVGSLVTVTVLLKAASNSRTAPETLRMLLMEIEARKFEPADLERVKKEIRQNHEVIVETSKVFNQWLETTNSAPTPGKPIGWMNWL